MAKSFSPTRGTLALLLGLSTLLPPILHAQAMPVVTGPGSYVTLGGTASLFQQDYGLRHVAGLTAFADINPTWRFGFEAEGRFLRYRQSENVHETTWLAGPRISIRPGPLRPYAKLLIGAGQIHLPFTYAQGTFFTYAPGAGLDYALNDRLNLRLVDVEYQLWTNFPYGGLHPYGISAGFSYRITGDFHVPRRGH